MLKVSLSKLEIARTNPTLIAQSLASNAKSGGNQGFVSKWKTTIRDFHEHDRTFDESLEKLDQTLWSSFNNTPQNKNRRKVFCESFEEYRKQFQELGLSIDKFQINLDWPIISQAHLTGQSPFLCSNDEYNIAYFFAEKRGKWYEELKYPLLQIYLADQFYKCEVDKVKIGVYSISEKQFDLRIYEDFELDNAFNEGKSVLKNVASDYNKIRG